MSRPFPVTVSMDENTLEQLDQLAMSHGGNRSKAVRELVRAAVAEAAPNDNGDRRPQEVQS